MSRLFPVHVPVPITVHAAVPIARFVNSSVATRHYTRLIEFALADVNDPVFADKQDLAKINAVLESFDLAVGSLRPHIDPDVLAVLLRRVDDLGDLSASIENWLYECRNGFRPGMPGMRNPPPHMTVLDYVLARFYDPPGDTWVESSLKMVDFRFTIMRQPLRHHMHLSEIIVDASTVGRTPAPTGLLPFPVLRPVHMAYANRLEWLDLPPDTRARLRDDLGLRFVFELGLTDEDYMTPQDVGTVNAALAAHSLYLRVGRLSREGAPLVRLRDLAYGIIGDEVIAKSGNCTLIALVMQTPADLGLTDDETRRARAFLAQQGLDFGRHLHDVIRERAHS